MTVATAPAAACHAMLLRLAGSVDDELLTCCRRWLAEGRSADLALAVADGVRSARVPMADEDVGVLAELLAAAGADPGVLSASTTPAADAPPAFWFQRGAPESLDAMAARADEKLAGVAVDSASRLPGVHGLWRSWRMPFDDRPRQPPRRVFVVEAEAGADFVALTGALQADLVAAGMPSPQVEVYEVGAELPQYQRLARALGELLWTDAPGPGPRLARLYDEIDPETGPRFAADHPRLDDRHEVSRIIGYLSAAEVVLAAGHARYSRPVGPLGAAVTTFRTDGAFVWADATVHYLDRFALSPDPDLLAHIRAADYVPPAVDGVAMHRATALLLRPGDGRPVPQRR
jgi:hypothetical protein